jgi:signal transduction histidine kinase
MLNKVNGARVEASRFDHCRNGIQAALSRDVIVRAVTATENRRHGIAFRFSHEWHDFRTRWRWALAAITVQFEVGPMTLRPTRRRWASARPIRDLTSRRDSGLVRRPGCASWPASPCGSPRERQRLAPEIHDVLAHTRRGTRAISWRGRATLWRSSRARTRRLAVGEAVVAHGATVLATARSSRSRGSLGPCRTRDP